MNNKVAAAFADGKIDRHLKNKKIKRPNKVFFNVASNLVHIVYKRQLNVKFVRKVNPREIHEPFIVVCNHVSRPDWYFAAMAIYPKTANFISAHNEFFGKELAGIFSFFNNIPKKVYQPDALAMKRIMCISKKNGNLIMYPTAIMSIDSMPKPIAPGTAKLLKKLGVRVLSVVINGGYMAGPKHTTNTFKGKVEVVLDDVFSANELKDLSIEEIQTRLHQAIDQCDFDWIARNKDVSFDTKGALAENLEVILYKCPICHQEFTHTTFGNEITCTSCGNVATIDGRYNFTSLVGTNVPNNLRDWINYQKSCLQKEIVSNENFSISCKVDFHLLPRDKPVHNNTIKVGNGATTLTRDGLTFVGDCYGEPFEMFFERAKLHSMIALKELNSFAFYYDDIWYDFHPYQAGISAKMIFACEEIYKLYGGEWVN